MFRRKRQNSWERKINNNKDIVSRIHSNCVCFVHLSEQIRLHSSEGSSWSHKTTPNMRANINPKSVLPFNEKIITMMMESERRILWILSQWAILVRSQFFWHVNAHNKQEESNRQNIPHRPPRYRTNCDEQHEKGSTRRPRSEAEEKGERNTTPSDGRFALARNMKPIIGKVWRSISS